MRLKFNNIKKIYEYYEKIDEEDILVVVPDEIQLLSLILKELKGNKK